MMFTIFSKLDFFLFKRKHIVNSPKLLGKADETS